MSSGEFETFFSDTATLCVNCIHFVNTGEQKGYGDELRWYDLYCGAEIRETGVDFVTGKLGYVIVNDLGKRSIVDEPYPSAYAINTDGQCELYIAKPGITDSSQGVEIPEKTPDTSEQ